MLSCLACRREFAFSPISLTSCASPGLGENLRWVGVAAGDFLSGFHEPYGNVFLNTPFEGGRHQRRVEQIEV